MAMVSGAKRNIVSSYVNFGVMMVLNLICNPLLLSFLGVTGFGIWQAAQKILEFATVTDGRATQALKWVVAFNDRSTESAERTKRQDVGAAVVIWFIWLPILLVVSAGLTLALPTLIKGIHGHEVYVVYGVAAALCANVVLTGMLGLPDAVLVGTNQGYRSMYVTTAVVGLSELVMLLAAALGWGVVSLGVVVLIANILNGGITYLVARRHVDWWGIARPRRAEVKTLASFSGWVLAWAFISKLLLASELILFSVLMGARAVSSYTFTAYAVVFGLQAALMTTSALMPKLGANLGAGDFTGARRVVEDARELTLAIIVIVGSGVLLLNRSFVDLWASPSRYLGNSVNALMVLAFVQLAIARNEAQTQDTGLNIRFKVLIGTLGTVTGLGAGWLMYVATHELVPMYLGLIGGRLLMSAIFPILVRRLVPGTRFDVPRHLAAALILLSSFAVGTVIDLRHLLPFLGGCAISISVLGAVAFSVLLGPRTRVRVLPKSVLRLSPSGLRVWLGEG
jgi:O-antigen/teichoic acid export membrane protein